MDSMPQPSRRQLIVGAGVGALALAGCGDGEESAPPTSGGEPTDGGQEPTEGTTLTALSEVPVGEAVLVDSAGTEILVCRRSEDEAVAYSAICTHKGCTVEPSGQELKCPCHSSVFSPDDGSVLGGPAEEPLAKIDVRVQGGNVVTGADS